MLLEKDAKGGIPVLFVDSPRQMSLVPQDGLRLMRQSHKFLLKKERERERDPRNLMTKPGNRKVAASTVSGARHYPRVQVFRISLTPIMRCDIASTAGRCRMSNL